MSNDPSLDLSEDLNDETSVLTTSLDLDQNHWMIVDTQRIEEVKRLIYTHEKHPEMRPLFANSPFEHLSDVGPVIFNISPQSPLLELWLQQFEWRISAVIFSISKDPLNTVSLETSFEILLTHLHQLLGVNILDKPAFFRFYTSSLWQEISNELTERDIHTILGPANRLSWVGERDDELSGKQQFIDELSHQPIAAHAITKPYSLQSNVFNQWI